MVSQQGPPGNAEGRLRNREKAVHTWSSATVAASFARLVCGPRSSPSLASLGLLRWWLASRTIGIVPDLLSWYCWAPVAYFSAFHVKSFTISVCGEGCMGFLWKGPQNFLGEGPGRSPGAPRYLCHFLARHSKGSPVYASWPTRMATDMATERWPDTQLQLLKV
jgi:hypothetical protein